MAKVELKQPIVNEIAETINGAQSALLVQYLGLTVEPMALSQHFLFSTLDLRSSRTLLFVRSFVKRVLSIRFTRTL